MPIIQGDIYWIHADTIPHPHVVIQDMSQTVVVIALTSNLKRVSMPGNVLIDAGEANLPKASVIEVSKVSTIEAAQLGDYIGTLDQRRIHQILAGMRFVQTTYRGETSDER